MAKNKKPIMSDIGLQMEETIERVKMAKGHAAAKEELKKMEDKISMIKKAYFHGVKTAEDLASNNEDFDASEEEKSKADKVINKLRVGWNADSHDARRERNIDKIQDAAEESNESRIQMNENSPELQDFSTDSMRESRNFDRVL